jgi:hypothetical protein
MQPSVRQAMTSSHFFFPAELQLSPWNNYSSIFSEELKTGGPTHQTTLFPFPETCLPCTSSAARLGDQLNGTEILAHQRGWGDQLISGVWRPAQQRGWETSSAAGLGEQISSGVGRPAQQRGWETSSATGLGDQLSNGVGRPAQQRGWETSSSTGLGDQLINGVGRPAHQRGWETS